MKEEPEFEGRLKITIDMDTQTAFKILRCLKINDPDTYDLLRDALEENLILQNL